MQQFTRNILANELLIKSKIKTASLLFISKPAAPNLSEISSKVKCPFSTSLTAKTMLETK
jgi:hypothetical protein